MLIRIFFIFLILFVESIKYEKKDVIEKIWKFAENYSKKKFSNIEELNDYLQKNWIRSGERFELQEKNIEFKSIESIIEELELNKEIRIELNEQNDIILILGSTLYDMEERIKHAISCGVKQAFLLTGEREINDNEKKHLKENIKTEIDGGDFLVEKYKNKISLKNIQTKAILLKNGKTRRPNTQDTIKTFIKKINLKPKNRIIIISCQPFCIYQYFSVKAVIFNHENIEVIGYVFSKNQNFIYLDTLARIIYTLKNEVYKK